MVNLDKTVPTTVQVGARGLGRSTALKEITPRGVKILNVAHHKCVGCPNKCLSHLCTTLHKLHRTRCLLLHYSHQRMLQPKDLLCCDSKQTNTTHCLVTLRFLFFFFFFNSRKWTFGSQSCCAHCQAGPLKCNKGLSALMSHFNWTGTTEGMSKIRH